MTRRTRLPLLLLLSALLCTTPAFAQQLATVLQASPLYDEPFTDARQTAELAARSSVTVLSRRGGWYQVRDPQGQQGWLHMSRIRLGDASEGGAVDASGLSQAQRLLQSGRAAGSGTTVATGIRGLDADDLGKSRPDHSAVERLAHYQASSDAARRFADAARLQRRSISYLREDK